MILLNGDVIVGVGYGTVGKLGRVGIEYGMVW